MNRTTSPTRFSPLYLTRASIILVACLAFTGCKKDGEPAPAGVEPGGTTEEANPAPSTPPKDPATAEAKPTDPTPEPTTPAAAPTEAPNEAPAPIPAPAGDAAPTQVVDDGTNALPTQVAPGDIVRTTKPRTPEHMIQQVLVASLEPDEAKGWALFKSLLHTDELHPNGLITRRSMNFAASRRKVDLFIVEKAPLPVFKVSRILDEGGGTLRFFVHNPESMPTPCTARIDNNLTPPAWRIGLCSL